MDIFNFSRSSDLKILVLALVAAVCDGATTPVLTVLLGQIFDNLGRFSLNEIDQSQFMASVLQSVSGIFSIALITVVITWLMVSSWYLFAGAQVRRTRRLAFSTLIHKPAEWFDSTQGSVGILTMTTKNIDDLFLALYSTAMIVQCVTTICGCVALAMYKCWSLTLVSLVGLPLIVAIGVLLSRPIQHSVGQAKEAASQAASLIHWAMSCIETVHLFNNEQFEVTRAEQQFKLVRKFYLEMAKYLNLQMALSKTIMLAMFIQSFYYGSKLVRKGEVSSGDVLVVFWCCMSIGQSLNAILPHLGSLQKGIVAARNISQLCDPGADSFHHFKKSIGLYPEPATGKISLFNVGKTPK